MSNTKEKILAVALRLFARDGYEGVSVSDISSAVGITKGALYKHFKNKRDVFESIVAKLHTIDAASAREAGLPEQNFDVAPETYRNLSPDDVKAFALSQFAFWTQDEFGRDLRKMLTLEQYRNDEIATLNEKCLTTGPLRYLSDVFLHTDGLDCSKSNAYALAVEFYAPIYLMINASDSPSQCRNATELLQNHVDSFFKKHKKE